MQLAAIQMGLDLSDYFTAEAFAARIDRLLSQVARRLDPKRPALVAFPEDLGLLLIVQGLERELAGVTGIQEAIGRAVRRFMVPVSWLRLRHGLSWVPALFLHRHTIIAKTYFATLSQAAQKYGVWIVGGSVVLPHYDITAGRVVWQNGYRSPHVYNSSFLFDPKGRVIGRQDKVHLIDLEREAALDLTPGSVRNLQSFPTPFGRIGIAICLDAFEDDVIEALQASGAEILVQPSANPGPWTEEQQLDWLRSSYNRTYVEGRFACALNPMMHGRLWDLSFYGQSSIVVRDHHAASYGYAHLGPMPGFHSVAQRDDAEEILLFRL